MRKIVQYVDEDIRAFGLNQLALYFCFDKCEAYISRFTVISFFFRRRQNLDRTKSDHEPDHGSGHGSDHGLKK